MNIDKHNHATIKCMNCGEKVEGTISYLMNTIPICNECKKNRIHINRNGKERVR